MRYQELLPQQVGEALYTIYSLGNTHGAMCPPVPEEKVEHDQIKAEAAKTMADTIGNIAFVGLRLDACEAKLRELGINPDDLAPPMEAVTVEIIPVVPAGTVINTPFGDIPIDVT